MTLLSLIFAGLAAAQSLPEAPKPQAPSIESGLTDLRSGFAAPSFADWQKRKQQEAFQPRRDDESGSAGGGLRLRVGHDVGARASHDFGMIRLDNEDLAIHVLQPAPGVKLGVFYANHDANYENREIYHDVRKGVQLTLQIGGEKKKAPAFHFPFTATYTETELSGHRVRAQTEDFDKGFKELKP